MGVPNAGEKRSEDRVRLWPGLGGLGHWVSHCSTFQESSLLSDVVSSTTFGYMVDAGIPQPSPKMIFHKRNPFGPTVLTCPCCIILDRSQSPTHVEICTVAKRRSKKPSEITVNAAISACERRGARGARGARWSSSPQSLKMHQLKQSLRIPGLNEVKLAQF